MAKDNWNAPRSADVKSFKPTRPPVAKSKDMSRVLSTPASDKILKGGKSGGRC